MGAVGEETDIGEPGGTTTPATRLVTVVDNEIGEDTIDGTGAQGSTPPNCADASFTPGFDGGATVRDALAPQ